MRPPQGRTRYVDIYNIINMRPLQGRARNTGI